MKSIVIQIDGCIKVPSFSAHEHLTQLGIRRSEELSFTHSLRKKYTSWNIVEHFKWRLSFLPNGRAIVALELGIVSQASLLVRRHRISTFFSLLRRHDPRASAASFETI